MAKTIKEILLEINRKFTSSAISIYAGQTAFFLILSFFPFLLFFFSLLNLTPISQADFLTWAKTLVPESFQDIMLSFVKDIYSSSTGRISVTIITALWLSSKAMVSMQYGLDSMYGIKETRNFILLRLWAVLYSLLLAVVLVAFLGLAVFGKSLREHLFPNLPLLQHIVTLRYLFLVPILFLLFLAFYAILPNGRVSFHRQFPGAIFASVGWVIFSFLFSIYVDHFCNYASIYGTMTTIILIMVWLYGCIYVVFLGGLINSLLGGHSHLESAE